MKKIPSFSVLTLFICLSIIGISVIPLLSVQLKPNRSSKSLSVSFSWHNASAKIIEQEVTSKLEGLFNSLEGIKEISSTSKKESGNINILLKKKTDVDIIRFEITNIIRQNYQNLPDGVSYPRVSINKSVENNSPILSYSINANESPHLIKRYAENYIVPKLSRIDGINQVSLYGAAPFEWVITYDSNKLLQYKISVKEIINSINEYLQKKELGTVIISDDIIKKAVSTELIFSTRQNFSWDEVPIKKLGDRILFLKDIAKVSFKEGEITAYYRVNGLNTLNMVIYPNKNVNSINLSNEIKKNIKTLEQEILKEGYHLKLTQDKSEYLIKELNKIKKRAFLSLLVLLVLSILIYRNFKYLLVLFTSIAVTLLVSFIFYALLKVELQLYSFAGVTISFGIIIDNSIIMVDHILTKQNKKVFLAILAATLTTIGSLVIIFLLEEQQRLNLLDFGIVIVVNMGVSLFVSLYFIPALLERLQIERKTKNRSIRRRKRIVFLTKKYLALIVLLRKPLYKWSLIALFILGFGLPIHLIPQKIENANQLGEIYNKTLGSNWFVNDIKPMLKKYMGGSFRLFTENVYENAYYSEPNETSITISGKMPEGSTIKQLNEVIEKMERYITSFDEISLFETRITSYRNSTIQIFFKKEFELTSFPHTLKNLLETKAISLGGLDWYISGVGRGFSNAIGVSWLGDRVTIEGYNYDELYGFVEELKKKIIESANGRVKKVEIASDRWENSSVNEYFLEFNPKQMALANISEVNLYSKLEDKLHYGDAQSIVNDNEYQKIKVRSNKSESYNIWELKNTPLTINTNQYKLNDLALIEKRNTGNTIKKRNQQYILNVAYNFIGSNPLARKFKERLEKEFKEKLPIGYKIQKSDSFRWNRKDKKQYYYLFIVFGIIFFICSILLESLRQPFSIILMIPISFIGVFLTFYLFDINFDQGGYASFILLSGITVNSALYIINDLNNTTKENSKRCKIDNYFKAFNSKIIPILITIVTTIVGLLPFVWGGQNEVFWFSFAAGSIGGLIFSIIGILIYLPLFVIKEKRPVIQ